jgi:hypothetical protein
MRSYQQKLPDTWGDRFVVLLPETMLYPERETPKALRPGRRRGKAWVEALIAMSPRTDRPPPLRLA